ncbi:MAG TPA: DUF1214 domain-containing protein, partial [Hyphomicrobiaceae bacterium]|nr:DUF1214 domain-containing protein [Hyphomicrobiaceae bacterium]
ERGSRLTTRTFGSWVYWPGAARFDADPYTRAHFARRGELPHSPALAMTFQARIDSDGNRLHSACEYEVAGPDINSVWWSLAVYDDRGTLIPNPAGRHAYNANSTLRAANGSFAVVLSREARPGNWLPTSGAGPIVLVLDVQEPRGGWPAPGTEIAALPVIKKVACR